MPLLPKVARAALHFWEEPCISGTKGSGTVFFSGCSLRCVFCQNYELSQKNAGKVISYERLAKIFSELESAGAHNINLVNPTHYVPAIKKALEIYRPHIPVVYNSGGYDSIEEINEALTFADVFLMDLKYLSRERALKYSAAADYPEVAKRAILKIREAIPENIFDSDGLMQKGLMIRHLILPQGTNEAISVLEWAEQNCNNAVFSLMSQYMPCGDAAKFKEINRRITLREHRKVLDRAAVSSIETIYTQKLNSSDEKFIPAFDLTGV